MKKLLTNTLLVVIYSVAALLFLAMFCAFAIFYLSSVPKLETNWLMPEALSIVAIVVVGVIITIAISVFEKIGDWGSNLCT